MYNAKLTSPPLTGFESREIMSTKQDLNEATVVGSALNVGLEGYLEMVRLHLAMDELDVYCTKACAFYMERGIPAVIAARNLRVALMPSNAVENI